MPGGKDSQSISLPGEESPVERIVAKKYALCPSLGP
jgi:hypothetical protein